MAASERRHDRSVVGRRVEEHLAYLVVRTEPCNGGSSINGEDGEEPSFPQDACIFWLKAACDQSTSRNVIEPQNSS